MIDIDLAALRSNWQTLASAAGGSVRCAGVVKANGYGLGLEQVTATLASAGCQTFFTATLAEAVGVRSVLPTATIYVLDGLLPGTAPACVDADLRPVLSSLDEIAEWSAFADASGRRLPTALQIDTGMRRMGLPPADIDAAAVALNAPACRIGLELIMSHLACADTPDHPHILEQRTAFEMARAKFPGVGASLANSAGVMLGSSFHYDLVRPGIALYGGRSVGIPNAVADRIKPVVTFSARILQIRNAAPGDVVGYGAGYQVRAPARIATVACGYADGFARSSVDARSGVGPVAHLGPFDAPIVGRISMDLITIDVTAVPERLATRGGWVELIGARTTIDDIADRAGTIGYEILTGLGPRALRRYHDTPDHNEQD